MSRWADSTDDDDDYLNEGDHEDYIDHAVGADEVSFHIHCKSELDVLQHLILPILFFFCLFEPQW